MKNLISAVIIIFAAFSSCKDKCKDKPDTNCQGMYVLREGKCQCPENSVDMGRNFCQPFSENNFWMQEGDPCLGQAYFFFGKTGTDIFDEGQNTIEMSWTQGDKGSGIALSVNKIIKLDNQHYLISIPFNDVNRYTNDFEECIGKDYN